MITTCAYFSRSASDKDFGACVIERIDQLGSLEPRVERNRHSADFETGKIAEHQFGRIGEEERDTVARSCAPLHKPMRDPFRQRIALRVTP